MQEIPDPASDPHAALMARYASGDAAAARLLLTELGPRVFGHARHLLGDASEAEDVVQEAMLRLWRIAPQWDPARAQVTTWLYRVTGNLCIDRMRKRKPAVAFDQIAEPVDPAPGAEAQMISAARVSALHRALQTLPDRQRQAVVLRHIEGLANPRIAQIMEIGVEAVESLTSRGKRALRRTLADQQAGLGFTDDKAG